MKIPETYLRAPDEAGNAAPADQPKTTEEILSSGNVIVTSSEAGQGNSSASTSTSGN